jgi:hypothetical protein
MEEEGFPLLLPSTVIKPSPEGLFLEVTVDSGSRGCGLGPAGKGVEAVLPPTEDKTSLYVLAVTDETTPVCMDGRGA